MLRPGAARSQGASVLAAHVPVGAGRRRSAWLHDPCPVHPPHPAAAPASYFYSLQSSLLQGDACTRASREAAMI